MRAGQEKRIATESALRHRVEELLAELADKRSFIDDLNDTLQSALGRASRAEGQVQELLKAKEDMVSKEQVKEMEDLFLDTVSRLSSRVQLLEKQKTVSTPPTSIPHGGSQLPGSSLAGIHQSRLVGRTHAADGRLASQSSESVTRPLLAGPSKVLEPGGRLRHVAVTGTAKSSGGGYTADSDIH
jgi:hypothetical protein